MTPELRQFFSQQIWHPDHLANENGGASSVVGTTDLRADVLQLLGKYRITSMFDSGCNDCGWMSLIIPHVQYQGGDVSETLIAWLHQHRPELDVRVHDSTTDPIPPVDLLFSRDVTIHLNNQDKKLFWKNWYASGIPWILTTHILDCAENLDFEYDKNSFPFAAVNWQIAPWNFPPPIDRIKDQFDYRFMALWHRDQFKGIL